jgi:hypothetical protein
MNRILLLIVLVASLPAMVMAQDGGISVEISLNQNQYLPDEDAILSVDVMNRSGQLVEFGADPNWISFSIQNDDNTIASSTGVVPTEGPFSLLTGQMGTKRFNLTPYFVFRQTGRYKVTATVRVPKWNLEVASKPVTFVVMNGVPMPGVPELTFGVPQSGSNSVPEVRRYTLIRSSYQSEPRLYFRLSDESGVRTIRSYMLGLVVTFAKPEVMLDSKCNFHALYQSYARTFSYFVINPEGVMLARQTYEYTQSRPVLRIDSEGRVYVSGGVRRVTSADWPKPTEAPVVLPDTNASHATDATNVSGK